MFRIGKEEIDAVTRVIQSRSLFRVNDSLKEVDNFERELKEKIGVNYALCLAGGTSALIAALVGAGIGPGDEVIVPGYTFMASASAVLAAGAIPVIAEIDETLTISPEDVKNKITPHTKAIIPVHILGYPCNMEKLCNIAKEHNLKIIEDACQADGGSYKGKRHGNWGDAGAFSFNHFKIISAGEGGAVVTNDRTIYERALVFHDGGASFRPYAGELTIPVFIGSQFRVSEVTGSILREQLKRLDGILQDLRNVKKRFIEALSTVQGIAFTPSNDSEGDCAIVIGFAFESEEKAREFAKSEGVEGWLPIDSGKHVYANWEPVLSKRGAHHPDINPFNLTQNKNLNMEYSKDMCPKTLSILSRTVNVGLSPDWTEEEIEQKIGACKKAVSSMKS